jgi:hypothetical protein
MQIYCQDCFRFSLRFDGRFITIRANAMAEPRLRMVADVAFNSLPVVLVITDAFAVRSCLEIRFEDFSQCRFAPNWKN